MDTTSEEVLSSKKIDTTTEDQQDGKRGSPKLFPIFSRYGRTIKPKSPSTVAVEYPKITKTPKIEPTEMATEDESIEMKMEDTSQNMDDTLNGSVMKEDIEIVDYEELKAQSQWQLGDLVWARIGSFPFWPAVVTLDPTTMTFIQQRGKLKYKSVVLHVRFCADKGRHSWVSSGSIISFLGLNDFETRSKQITPDLKKREPKFAAAFCVKPSIKLQWDDAVAEASGLMAKSIEKRIELFKPKSKLNDSINKSASVSESTKKRKHTLTEDEIKSKKIKTDPDGNEDQDEENKISIANNISIETPPTPPSSHKDSSDEAPTKKVSNKKRLGKEGEGVFEIFCERNREIAEKEDPDATEADIKTYLIDAWEKMSTLERSKYRADYLIGEDMSIYMGDQNEDEEESDQEADKSTRRKTKDNSEELSDQEEKPARKRRTKTDLNRSKDEGSDQEETTSVESEILEKSVKKRKPKPRRESSDREDSAFVESEDKPVKKRKSKFEKDEEVIGADLILKPRTYRLFKGMKNERVCQICEQVGKLVRCKGPCYSYFHLSCVKPGESSPEPSEAGDVEENSAFKDLKEMKTKLKELNNQKEEENLDEESFKCIDCLSGIAPACFVCHKREGERTKCSTIACGKHYHVDCLKSWPQSVWQGERLNCPYHVCHTCVSDNPQNGHPRGPNERFVRCIRCPSTYHASISCLPAGSNILTGMQIVCPKHYKSAHPPINATWCFLCCEGGSLICCDTCPMSFHLDCLSIDAPDGAFICEDCETGRLPLYGEVVWVKHGNYRWWPSIICFPQDVPANIALMPHKTGEFCVMFLGTRNYFWIHRGKAFLFQDGDANAKVIGNKKVEESYRKAVEEAKIYHERLMSERAIAKDRDNGRNLKPPPYVKLKVNKPVGNVKIPEPDSMQACECDPNMPNPCSPDSDCLNRILMIECSPDACAAGSKCQNQMFVQRKYPAMKPVHTEERGWGLKTLDFISQGQFIIEYVGEIIDEAEYRQRIAQKKERKNDNYYFLTIDNSRMIDAEPKGNLSRFMNHSCQPNCETQKWTVNGDTRIGLFALRDIQAGDELTFNYNLACDGETKKPCLCKAPNCSGFIGLKVPKNQISLAQQSKIEKVEKVKRHRKHKKEMICWSCNEKIEKIDESFRCDQKTCGKMYHPHCIAIEDGPDQIFHCPWHFCAECFKRTSIRCVYCCNAFCQQHIQGNLNEHPETGAQICYRHPVEYADFIEMDLGGEALMDDDDDGAANTSDSSLNLTPEEIFPETVDASSPKANDKVEESRGAIVEVQPSSEDGEDDSQLDEDEDQDRSRRKRSKKKKQKNGKDLTVDQIAAIIGIVK